jgi:hypothetical protein
MESKLGFEPSQNLVRDFKDYMDRQVPLYQLQRYLVAENDDYFAGQVADWLAAEFRKNLWACVATRVAK